MTFDGGTETGEMAAFQTALKCVPFYSAQTTTDCQIFSTKDQTMLRR